jgi:N-acetylglucosamine-6-phosphate deacetylase
MKRTTGQWLDGKSLVDGTFIRLHLEEGRISSWEPLPSQEGEQLPWIAPGLVDLQINGFAGLDFNSGLLSEEDIHAMTAKLWEQGVTSYFPTVITNSPEAIEAAVKLIAGACRSNPLTAASIPGIHLEGPFLSPEDGARGAHDIRFVQAPDWDLFVRWQEAAGGLIRILTLSPEWENATAFISRCSESGVTVSIGHTAASPEQIRDAVAAGARMSTHLGNAAHLMLPRHPNYIWEQLAQDELTACIIADGFHLPDALLKVFMRAKQEHIVLVSDAVYISGLQPGPYTTHIGGKVVLTEEGRLHLAAKPELLAGSAQMITTGIERLYSRGLASLAEAWDMASLRPANLLGLADKGHLEVGACADLILFDFNSNDNLTSNSNQIRIREVYKDGRKVIG